MSAAWRYWAVGKLVPDTGQAVYSDAWTRVVLASEYQAVVEENDVLSSTLAFANKELLKLEAELARVKSRCKSVELVMFCEKCDNQHIDEGEWTIRLHHTHLCLTCGHTWDTEFYSVGVKETAHDDIVHLQARLAQVEQERDAKVDEVLAEYDQKQALSCMVGRLQADLQQAREAIKEYVEAKRAFDEKRLDEDFEWRERHARLVKAEHALAALEGK